MNSASPFLTRLSLCFYRPTCSLFFKQDPLKIDYARGQYMYDENDARLIDCINNVAHGENLCTD